MSVKGIFKTLIGTVLLIVVSSLIIEMINLTISSLELNQISKIACRQAAVLFSQETYKKRDYGKNGGSISIQDVLTCDGSTYISGQFYGSGTDSTDPGTVYNQIYTKSEFKSWVNTYGSNWRNIQLINKGLNGTINLSMPSSTDTESWKEYTESVIAKSYTEVYMTPLNMGVPYLDKAVVQEMFKWNLARLTSNYQDSLIRNTAEIGLNSDPTNLGTDPKGYYVYYNGFKVYAQNATVELDNSSYRVYDMDSSNDVTGKEAFIEMTHITNVDNLGFLTSTSDSEEILGIEGADERKKICVVEIKYTVPIAYEGITPLKRIFEMAWNYEVDGFQKQDGTDSSNTQTYYEHWDNNFDTLESGGFNGNTSAAGVLPVPGKLIYHVVR